MKTIKNEGSNDKNNKNTKMSQQQRDNNFLNNNKEAKPHNTETKSTLHV